MSKHSDFFSSGQWGKLTGTITDQTDLQTALASKLSPVTVDKASLDASTYWAVNAGWTQPGASGIFNCEYYKLPSGKYFLFEHRNNTGDLTESPDPYASVVTLAAGQAPTVHSFIDLKDGSHAAEIGTKLDTTYTTASDSHNVPIAIQMTADNTILVSVMYNNVPTIHDLIHYEFTLTGDTLGLAQVVKHDLAAEAAVIAEAAIDTTSLFTVTRDHHRLNVTGDREVIYLAKNQTAQLGGGNLLEGTTYYNGASLGSLPGNSTTPGIIEILHTPLAAYVGTTYSMYLGVDTTPGLTIGVFAASGADVSTPIASYTPPDDRSASQDIHVFFTPADTTPVYVKIWNPTDATTATVDTTANLYFIQKETSTFWKMTCSAVGATTITKVGNGPVMGELPSSGYYDVTTPTKDKDMHTWTLSGNKAISIYATNRGYQPLANRGDTTSRTIEMFAFTWDTSTGAILAGPEIVASPDYGSDYAFQSAKHDTRDEICLMRPAYAGVIDPGPNEFIVANIVRVAADGSMTYSPDVLGDASKEMYWGDGTASYIGDDVYAVSTEDNVTGELWAAVISVDPTSLTVNSISEATFTGESKGISSYVIGLDEGLFILNNSDIGPARYNTIEYGKTGATQADINGLPAALALKADITYVDSQIAGLASEMTFKGGYNAATNTPDLDTAPTGVVTGDTYVVTADGTFFTASVTVGDLLVANVDGATLEANWTIVPSGEKTPPRHAWQVHATAYTAVSGDQIVANTSGGAWTLTLPATPAANDHVTVADYAGTFATNNLTVSGNGSNIQGSASAMILDANDITANFVYIDATQGWKILN